MNLLLDTHLFLWAASTPARLTRQANELLIDATNMLHFSVASLWEILIKMNTSALWPLAASSTARSA